MIGLGFEWQKNRKVKIGKKLNKCHFAQFTFFHQGSEKKRLGMTEAGGV